jgi:hypothetical protein
VATNLTGILYIQPAVVKLLQKSLPTLLQSFQMADPWASRRWRRWASTATSAAPAPGWPPATCLMRLSAIAHTAQYAAMSMSSACSQSTSSSRYLWLHDQRERGGDL